MRIIAFVIVAAVTLAAQGDILHLRDGSRHSGTLISRSESEVVFRIILSDGVSSVVKRFPAATVKAVQRGPDAPRVAARPARSRLETQPTEDFEQMLREGFELIDDGDLHAAVRALQRTVIRAPAATLPQLDEQCRQSRGVPLAELLAEVRIRAGLRRDGFWIRYATPYESAALGRNLRERHDALLAAEYHGRSIAVWARNPAEYDVLQPDARRMVANARRAAGMLGVRLCFDPQLKEDRVERKRLLRLRSAVARFVAHVTSMRGYTEPLDWDKDNPAAVATRRLAAEQKTASQPTSQPAGTGETEPRP